MHLKKIQINYWRKLFKKIKFESHFLIVATPASTRFKTLKSSLLQVGARGVYQTRMELINQPVVFQTGVISVIFYDDLPALRGILRALQTQKHYVTYLQQFNALFAHEAVAFYTRAVLDDLNPLGVLTAPVPLLAAALTSVLPLFRVLNQLNKNV